MIKVVKERKGRARKKRKKNIFIGKQSKANIINYKTWMEIKEKIIKYIDMYGTDRMVLRVE